MSLLDGASEWLSYERRPSRLRGKVSMLRGCGCKFAVVGTHWVLVSGGVCHHLQISSCNWVVAWSRVWVCCSRTHSCKLLQALLVVRRVKLTASNSHVIIVGTLGELPVKLARTKLHFLLAGLSASGHLSLGFLEVANLCLSQVFLPGSLDSIE